MTQSKTAKLLLGGGALLACGSVVSLTTVSATEPITTNDVVNVAIDSSCSVNRGTGETGNYEVTLLPGENTTVGPSTFSIFCNDVGGWEMTAVGDGNDPNSVASLYSAALGLSIPTGTSGSGSYWNMSVAAVSGTYTPTIFYGSTAAVIPTTETKIASYGGKTDSTEGSNLTTSYSVNASSAQVAGTYVGKVKYTVSLANPYVPPKDDITTISTMQAMNVLLCQNTSVGVSTQLKDSRDNKWYWVAKMADGNCWMTQNLDLDLTANVALTSELTDVSDSWTPSVSTYTTAGTWSSSYTTPQSYDPGNYYLAEGTAQTGTATLCNSADSRYLNCHYHQGNYYNWYAATAGSDASTMSENDEAPQSICPRGWRLPYGTQANKSWHYLVNQAGITASNITTSPFYIPRAGYYGGSVGGVGTSGVYWSSTAYGDVGGYGAHSLDFYASSVAPLSSSYAIYGYSVRCVSS